MTAKEFIQGKLDELQAAPNVAMQGTGDLPNCILKLILSKKFRKFSVAPEYTQHIQAAIENSIKNNEPIRLVFPFGGYKLWRLEETPEADWAELFTVMHYAKWLKPITEVYGPGVWFDFSSDDMIVERMNNIPKSDTDAYAKSFHGVLDFIQKYLPATLKFTVTPVSSHYTPEEFEEDLKDKIAAMEKELGGLPVLDERHTRMVELNVRLKPGQSDDPLWREKTEILHQAYYTVSKRRPYTRSKEKILTFCNKMASCVPVGTTKTSVAKFWVGVGALKKTNDAFLEYVLSPSQLAAHDFTLQEIHLDGLVGKNFETIKVFS